MAHDIAINRTFRMLSKNRNRNKFWNNFCCDFQLYNSYGTYGTYWPDRTYGTYGSHRAYRKSRTYRTVRCHRTYGTYRTVWFSMGWWYILR